MLVPLPRVGLQLFVDPKVVSWATWRGRGPHECYPDRKASAIDAVHSSSIPSLYVPYLVPGENANRTDVDWLLLHDSHESVRGGDAMRTVDSFNDINDEGPGTPKNRLRKTLASPSPLTASTPTKLDTKLAGIAINDSTSTQPQSGTKFSSPSPSRKKAKGKVNNAPELPPVNPPKHPESTPTAPPAPIISYEDYQHTFFESSKGHHTVDGSSAKTPSTRGPPPLPVDLNASPSHKARPTAEHPKLRVSCSRPFNFSALEYTTEDLEAATHSVCRPLAYVAAYNTYICI